MKCAEHQKSNEAVESDQAQRTDHRPTGIILWVAEGCKADITCDLLTNTLGPSRRLITIHQVRSRPPNIFSTGSATFPNHVQQDGCATARQITTTTNDLFFKACRRIRLSPISCATINITLSIAEASPSTMGHVTSGAMCDDTTVEEDYLHSD